jgi:hypothetical protein
MPTLEKDACKVVAKSSADGYIDLVPSLADKVKAIEEQIEATHKAQAPSKAAPSELVARSSAAENVPVGHGNRTAHKTT